MTIEMPCKRCRQMIIAEDEEDLIAQVEAHARDHGGAHGKHVPTPVRILSHLRGRTPPNK